MPSQEQGSHSVPVELKQSSVMIPSTPIGIVDTVRVKIDWLLNEQDLEDLLYSGGWKQKGIGLRKTYLRVTDGLRIIAFEAIVMVEVSMPRLLGLYSDEQHLVSVDDLLSGLRAMTVELLPRTTEDALKRGHKWHITRIDLAVNFGGSVSAIAEVGRKLNFRPTIQAAATVFEGSGIAFYGANSDAIVYDTAKRPPRGKLSRSLRDQVFAAVSSQTARFEFRFKTPRAIQRLLEGMRTADRGLPFMVGSGINRRVRAFHVDYHFLHNKLATQAVRFGQWDAPRSAAGNRGASAALIALLGQFGDCNPIMYAVAEGFFKPDTWRKKLRAVGQLQARLCRRSVVDIAWARPRPSPELRKRLLQQQEEDPGLHRSGSSGRIPRTPLPGKVASAPSVPTQCQSIRATGPKGGGL